MEVKQIYDLVNQVSEEVLGKTDLVKEDLTGVVDLGEEVINADAVDNYVKSLVNHIGKVVFVDRPYSGKVPSVLMDSWEFGSVLEKISAELPEAEENESWNLIDGKTYDQDVFHAPKVSAKFFNGKTTFEVPISITEMQVKESFSSRAQLNGFMSMIYNSVDKAMTIRIDSLIMRTIDNMIGETVLADATTLGENYTAGSTNRCVNVLKLYNTQFGTTLTPKDAIYNPDFIRYASFIIASYQDRMGSISTLFNIGGKDRFTSSDRLHTVLLSEFKNAANTYLQADIRHNELTALPNAESVPYWQASGLTYDFADTSRIDIKTSDGKDVSLSGIIGVMFDRDALGVSNLDKRVTSAYNAKAEFYNNFYKFDAGYFNDTNENFVVFYLA